MERTEERSAPIGMGFLTEASLQKGDTKGIGFHYSCVKRPLNLSWSPYNCHSCPPTGYVCCELWSWAVGVPPSSRTPLAMGHLRGKRRGARGPQRKAVRVDLRTKGQVLCGPRFLGGPGVLCAPQNHAPTSFCTPELLANRGHSCNYIRLPRDRL